MTKNRWGALAEDWDFFANDLALTPYLLPVISNPTATISPGSGMLGIGKTPSIYNRAGFVAGFPAWTEHTTTSKEIERWKQQGDYGLCIRTGYAICALDVDVKDKALAHSLALFISERYKFPIRFRADSAKFLLTFRCELGAKRVMRLSKEKGGPMIELLATGQQFVAVGAHPDGERYTWDWNGYTDIPTLEPQQLEELWDDLYTAFGVAQATASSGARKAKSKGDRVVADDVAQYLWDHDLVLDEGRNAELFIECPWAEGHSSDSGVTQTAFFPPGGRGYQRGHFKCLHAGCAEHDDAAFMEAIGYNDNLFEALPPEPVAVGAPPRKIIPGFARDKKGNILATLDNVGRALEEPSYSGLALRTDKFRDEVMVARVTQPDKKWSLRDADQVKLRRQFENDDFKPIAGQLMRDAILAHADEHEYDSAIEWLTGLPVWDGQERVETFLTDCFGVEDNEYTRATSRYIWTALAGRVMTPGVKADMVPILSGPQGQGKSSAIEAMAPDPECFVEIKFDDREENTIRMMRGRVLAEIAELQGLHTRDLESIKAFVARRFETWVPKYREFAIRYPRRLVFIGTTNQEEFLADQTGNRRWLPVVVRRVDMKQIVANRDQLWAEGRALYEAGGVDWSAEKLANAAHDRHMMIDAWQEAIERWLDTEDEVGGEGEESPATRGFFLTESLMEGALGLTVKNCKKADQQRVGAILRKLGWERNRQFIAGRQIRGWGKA